MWYMEDSLIEFRKKLLLGMVANMETIKREFSIIDKSENIQEIFRLHKFPVHMGVTEETEEHDLYEDLIFCIDKENGMIQLNNIIPENILYQKAHYNNVAKSWLEHHNAFARFIYKYHPTKIFEIGGGTGILSCQYNDLDKNAEWTILDSVPNPVGDCKAKYISGFFDENYIIPKGYDAVVHSHTLEHFYKPQECLQAIGKNMSVGSWLFMSIPNMESAFEKLFTNILNFEHSYYCAEPYITYMLKKSGYEVVEKEIFKDDHSIFFAAKKISKSDFKINFEGYYNKNKKLFSLWVDYHQKLVQEINEKLEKIDNSKSIYLFGAHVYSQYLISFGMQTTQIKCVFDNDKSKQGKRLCGTKFIVSSPEILQGEIDPIVIVHAGTHNEEIKEQLKIINETVVII